MIKDTETIVDIENNRSECKEDPITEHVTGSKRVKNALKSLGLTLNFNGLDDDQNSTDSNINLLKSSDDECNDIESLTNDKFEGEKGDHMPHLGKTHLKEKQKVKNSKKASKPPRPRRGPSLSTSDLRLVKEISELVMKKRARNERLKSLKKSRSTRASSLETSSSSSSSNMSLFAMMITIIFLIVIILQGFGSRTTGLVQGHFDSKLPK